MTPTDFIARWQHAGGSELANAQSFVRELAELLGEPPPNPAREDTRDNDYVFERRVIFRHGDGSSSEGRIDCYKRGHFVLEAKKLKQGPQTKGFDDAMLRARAQAEGYARALPADEGRPLFIVTVDVGNVLEIYAEFSRSGATYTPFPDPRSHRIKLADLADDAIRARLKAIWTDPQSLDPSRAAARATRQIAEQLAGVAKALESAGHAPERVAGFLTRCLFSMFAEDVGLLPARAFSDLLDTLSQTPDQFVPLVGALWKEMDEGGFSVVLRHTLPRFNGKLFKAPDVLPLTRDQIDLLRAASRADWTQVEPAIFGTLLERALDPAERHSLGAHYTPRPYVERLVLPTVIEPLRQRWQNVQAAALLLANEGKPDAALREIDAFHHALCQVRVLDPACGSANFLYVTLEHMKRLEGELLDFAHSLSGGQQRLEAAGLTVDPHQFLGLEINPRAAAIAELVLWIGYLQWHFRTRSAGLPPSPILRDFHNIECRDAVLDYASRELVTDPHGQPLSRWDGVTTKVHPVTGEDVPDEAARIPLWRYFEPKPAEWPAADFIVGNPPFIGAKYMRAALGDGYVEALRSTWPEVPESADYVMFWWHAAARRVLARQAERFGFITTNSLTQTFNRRVVQTALDKNLTLAFAVPDHPWVDSADGAAVRIAMTVGSATENGPGTLSTVTDEVEAGGEGLAVTLATRRGRLHADLRIGADVASAGALRANGGISSPGFKLHGAGFIVTPEEAASLEADAPIRDYRNGKDLTDRPRGVKLIDLFGLTAAEARSQYPATFQRVLERVKPERDHNARATYRDNWWIFGEPRREFRPMIAGLPRYIATVITAKHRVFQFLDVCVAPDDALMCFGVDDAYLLGVLSSSVHERWMLATGSTLEDRPRYIKSACFETFPFPDATTDQQTRIRDLAEQLDAHRKARQAADPALTLTGIYNVLAKLRAGEPLTAKDKAIHQSGLVGVLATLHAELDAAVLAAYGWPDLAAPLAAAPGTAQRQAAEETLLERLVALNAERRREEAAGRIRWLRPDFQNPQATLVAVDPEKGAKTASTATGVTPPAAQEKSPWPPTLPEQMALLARLLAAGPFTEAQLATRITGKGPWKKRLPDLLQTLVALGRARQEGETWVAV
ncbi:MAG: class I SAM-dependent DNA methyltransferase [Azonexus sp.]|nr:class I SAM-dependent DNA methyltransferase [Azonexus sp.]